MEQAGFGPGGFTIGISGPSGEELRQFPAWTTEVTVGRDPGCHIALSDGAISRQHLILRASPEGITVEDTSANGTLVDGVLLQRTVAMLHPASSIRLGRYELRFAAPVEALPTVCDDNEGISAPGEYAEAVEVRQPTTPEQQPHGQQMPQQPAAYGQQPQMPAPQAAQQQPAPHGQQPQMPQMPVPHGQQPQMPQMPQAAQQPAPQQPAAHGQQPAPQQPAAHGQQPAPQQPAAHGQQPQMPQMPVPQAAQQPAPQQPAKADTPESAEAAMEGADRLAKTGRVSAQVRRKLHKALVENLDLIKLERSRLNPRLLRAKVVLALKEIAVSHAHIIPRGTNVEQLLKEISDEAVGLGPLEDMLADDSITEIMVIDPSTIYIERNGKMQLTSYAFTDNESLRSTLERIVMPLGRRIDESAPMLDARLKDGSRVNAVIPPLATRGPCITIRKFAKKALGMEDLLKYNSINKRMALFLERSVRARKNIVVAGGTGSGKTTLLNILSAACSRSERIVTIEDSAELQLQQDHVITLEARPPNMEGKGAVTIRDLVKNAMRMRPDRVIVGECRGGEALDMLLAMNTGHDGSMTTTHANSCDEALRRLESLALMSGVDLPSKAIREQIAYAVDLLVHQTRFSDGTRRVTSITEVVGLEDGQIETREIFGYRKRTTENLGEVTGEFFASGYLPSYLVDFVALGILKEGDVYL